MPDADKIVRLSELFGVTADQLLRDDLDAPAPGRPSAGEPASESGPRRITELDSYDFIIRWQSESRRWALGAGLGLRSRLSVGSLSRPRV